MTFFIKLIEIKSQLPQNTMEVLSGKISPALQPMLPKIARPSPVASPNIIQGISSPGRPSHSPNRPR